MSNQAVEKITLGEAASRFLMQLSAPEKEKSQPEVTRFVRWYGAERILSSLTAPEIANYAERLSLSDTDYVKKFEMVKAFLAYAKKEKWSASNLGVHLKARKGKGGTAVPQKQVPREAVSLTHRGYEELKAELEELKKKRPLIIEDIRRAAADKDFRENAPLHAAKEQLGHLEGRIIELEETLKYARIIDDTPKSSARVGIGDSLILLALNSGEEIRYTIVPPREVDPLQGKISSVSPIGKALIGRGEEETVEVVVPAGKLRYRIKRIEHKS
jgi:transcription elongation factor GreA